MAAWRNIIIDASPAGVVTLASILSSGGLFALYDAPMGGKLDNTLWIDSIPPRYTGQDVMLREIVEKNEGQITKVNCNSKGSVVSIEFLLKGIPKTYVVGNEIRIVNGKALVKASRLMAEFSLTETQATHQPGNRFAREEDAAMAFGLMYLEKARREQQEYGASIDKWHPTGELSFSIGDMNYANAQLNLERAIRGIIIWSIEGAK
ncbi:MAG: hypothetical protein FWG42_08320 [Clostridiales bacterium]|nr:hypothetical protein [Clostridiales bacterium]